MTYQIWPLHFIEQPENICACDILVTLRSIKTTRMTRVTLTKISTAFLPCTWFGRSQLQQMKTTPISPLQPIHIARVNNNERHLQKIGKLLFSAYNPFTPTSNGCRMQARLRLRPQLLRATSAACQLLPSVHRPCACRRSPPLPVPGSLDQSNKSSHRRLYPAPNHRQYTTATKWEP